MVTSARADSIGAFIGLPTPAIVWSQSQPYTWTSTTVHLSWQRDGNLVLYCNSDTSDPNKVLWATGTDYTNPVDIVFGGPYGVIAVRDDWDTVTEAAEEVQGLLAVTQGLPVAAEHGGEPAEGVQGVGVRPRRALGP